VKNDTRTFYEAAVQRAVERICSQLDDALDVGALARSAALSPLHFTRVFRGAMGETPLELHRRLRLERAAQVLANGDEPVTRIAFEAGYETHESFTRAFGDRYGASPSAFRQKASEARTACSRPPQTELACLSGLHFARGQNQNQNQLRYAFINKEELMTMHVDVKELATLRLAAVHHKGPYNQISEAFARLDQLVRPAGLIQQGCQMLAVYHDDPESTPVDQLKSDAAISVPENVTLPEGLTELRIPAGRYATTTHEGPYTKLGDAWAQFMGGWLPKSEHRVGDGPSVEIYRNTPMDTPPEKLRTEMYLPLAVL